MLLGKAKTISTNKNHHQESQTAPVSLYSKCLCTTEEDLAENLLNCCTTQHINGAKHEEGVPLEQTNSFKCLTTTGGGGKDWLNVKVCLNKCHKG